MTKSKEHWENIYKTKPSSEVSWYAPRLEKSLELILGLGLPEDAPILDVGGGASTLPDDLLANGFRDITVLDISAEAIKVSKARLTKDADKVHWLEADITQVALPMKRYRLWHDRAVFHFLTRAQDRQRYVETLKNSLADGGYALIATFGPNGPLKCSGLEIVRYSKESLKTELGEGFRLAQHIIEIHKTPFATNQEFLYSLFSS